jgi:hypothetical protein
MITQANPLPLRRKPGQTPHAPQQQLNRGLLEVALLGD